MPTDEAVAFYEARAAGGVGLIVTGGTDAHASTAYRGRRAIEAFESASIPALEKVAQAIHRHGAKIFGQIAHLGREYNRELDDAEWPAFGPSSVAGATSLAPHEMSVSEIVDFTAGYARSAHHLVTAGYDGVEIQANHGYLAAQFLSPRANRRLDQYGGSPENRLRFLVDVISAVRRRIGDTPTVGVRLSADEEIEGGLRVPDAKDIVTTLGATGAIDYVSLSVGLSGSYIKDMFAAEGCAETRIAEIKRSTHLPIVISQRITRPEMAEEFLVRHSADLIGMARALIADPEWAAKAQGGRTPEIRPCVGSVQGCHTFPLGCTQNPEAGRELIWTHTRASQGRSSQARNVAVVGGGPAELEAARVAASCGHRVTLYEAQPTLGGQVTVAANAPGRSILREVIEYRRRELDRLRVTVRLNAPATAAHLIAGAPDLVIVATGARPRRPTFDGSHRTHVVTVWDVLQGTLPAARGGEQAQCALVVDDGTGSWEVFGAVEYLAETGIKVHFVTSAFAIGGGIPKESLRPLLQRIKRRNVDIHLMTRVVSVSSDTVRLCDSILTEGEALVDEREIAADLVVAYAGKEADLDLFEALNGRVPAIQAVGDCLAPRRIREAIYEGYRAGRAA